MSDQLLQRITMKPGRCGGRPCIRDSRIRVIDILETLAHGGTVAELSGDFPYLEPEDIQACLLYAARAIENNAVAA
jgi:uncharacterized protein (DUF433 family)